MLSSLLAIWTFYNVASFWLMGSLWLADWVTGTTKALVYKEFSWKKFPVALIRIPTYLIVFAGVHAVTLFAPMTAPAEQITVLTFASKEFVSVLQNLKAIGMVYGVDVKPLEALIQYLRLHAFQSVLDDYQSKAQEKEAV